MWHYLKKDQMNVSNMFPITKEKTCKQLVYRFIAFHLVAEGGFEPPTFGL
jgi:hypothetical protein